MHGQNEARRKATDKLSRLEQRQQSVKISGPLLQTRHREMLNWHQIYPWACPGNRELAPSFRSLSFLSQDIQIVSPKPSLLQCIGLMERIQLLALPHSIAIHRQTLSQLRMGVPRACRKARLGLSFLHVSRGRSVANACAVRLGLCSVAG